MKNLQGFENLEGLGEQILAMERDDLGVTW